MGNVTAQAKTRPVMGQPESAGSDSPEAILDSSNQAWRRYWEAYIELQDQLYETLRAAREVQWLVATDQGKVSEVNRLQRELFASVPRPLDYVPLSQISLDLDSAPSKIGELDAALSSEEEACRKLNAEIGSSQDTDPGHEGGPTGPWAAMTRKGWLRRMIRMP